jgi:hypothetical protein
VKYAKCVKIWPFVWKFDFHLIFVPMFENMVICVEILLSLDICVKYAQCVKIWLFLKCVQFPKALCPVSGEAKGRHAYRTRISHLTKGRRTLSRRVSLLLNMHTKKESI